MTAEEVALSAAAIVVETLEANGFTAGESEAYPKPMRSHYVLAAMRRGLNPCNDRDLIYLEFFSDYAQVFADNMVRNIRFKYLEPDFDKYMLTFLDRLARKPRGMQEEDLHRQQAQGGG